MKKLLYIAFLFLTVFAFGQEKDISGNVSDEKTGEPLPGATVIIKNTTKGTNADLDGNYSLKNVTLNDTLVFSYVGYISGELKVGVSNMLNVRLQENENIEEIELPYELPRFTNRSLQLSWITSIKAGTNKDRRNANNPKYMFRKNAKSNVFVVFVSELTSYNFNDEELEFQGKYNIRYSLTTNRNIEFMKKQNELIFKHLNKKYSTDWQNEIRKDAIGLDEFLK